ncbi:MAG: XRE family transcriptional regulator [Methylococcaceae bacterium]|nr:MAG: XRE family transcriptional regulator [Methylococcaceae bacterium]
MSIEAKSMHITPAGGNVFADLGFEPAEATALQGRSQRIVSEKLAIKESLMTEISGWIAQKNLKQAEAAEILGISRPRVSDVIHKKSIKFTIDALVDMLTRTGKQVVLTVR